MRDVVVSTGPLSYRSDGSIGSLPTTCTHEARRGRGPYIIGREILSLPLAVSPACSALSRFPVYPLSLLPSFSFSPSLSRSLALTPCLPLAGRPSHTGPGRTSLSSTPRRASVEIYRHLLIRRQRRTRVSLYDTPFRGASFRRLSIGIRDPPGGLGGNDDADGLGTPTGKCADGVGERRPSRRPVSNDSEIF